MKSLLAIVLLSLGVTACGGAGKSTGSTSHTSTATAAASSTSSTTASNATRAGRDSNDSDDDPNSNDDYAFLEYGHAASKADEGAVTTLVKLYYTAAAAADGVKACPLIYGLVAERIPEEFAQSRELSGGTCAAVMSKVFKQRHQQVAVDLAVLKVTRVRIGGNKGFAFVFRGKVPEPYITVHREGGAWKIESLFDTGLP